MRMGIHRASRIATEGWLNVACLNKCPLLILILFLLITPVSAEYTKVLFSPNGGCQEAIVEEISKDTKTIEVAMNYLTRRGIVQELVRAKKRNVAIRVFLDASQEKSFYSKSRYLMRNDIAVRFYTGRGAMHNKFAIIDGKLLMTGSFDWTATADMRNQENLLIMTDKDLIKQYTERFEYLWKDGKTSKMKLEKDDKISLFEKME